MTVRVETIGEAVLYLGDCLEVLGEHGVGGSVSAVITDPPYCSGGFTETAKKQATGQGLRSETIREIGWFAGDNMTTGALVWLMRSVAVQCNTVLRDGGTLSTFTDWRMALHLAPAMESARFRFQNLVVWDKGVAGLGTGFRAQHELVLHFAKGVPQYHDFAFGNVLKASRITSSEREHQTEKPVDLICSIVRVVSPADGTILDPFIGSGTTGVACALLGRKFIGIEIDPGYFSIACRRIERAYAQPRLFAEPAPKPQQIALDYDAQANGAQSYAVYCDAMAAELAERRKMEPGMTAEQMLAERGGR